MINIATTIEQSRELVRLGLDPKTADMVWMCNKWLYSIKDNILHREQFSEQDTLSWSLPALLEVMPNETRLLKAADNGTYLCDIRGFSAAKWYDNPIDAVFAMIVYLLEQGLIKKVGQDGN